MKAYYTATEKILEDRLELLVKLLSNRSKMCLNRKLMYLDKEIKRESINKIILFLYDLGEYTRKELHPLKIWDNENTLKMKSKCYSLLNKLYGYTKNKRL
jgi:hypothetical protein|tara:strand:+ start:1412 stop:1711 length:300 start_codon:yes stop_codon:yes gene_type:complete